MADFNLAIPLILKHEGGFVDDKTDPGGATNFGISLRYLKSLGELGDIDGDGDVDYQDVKNMTQDNAINLYKIDWWDKYNYSLINEQTIANKLFDMSVNMGQSQAIKITQRACNCMQANLLVDGRLGLNTFKTLNKLQPNKLLDFIRHECANFYLDLIAAKPSFIKYKNGWLKRAYS